LLETDIWHFHRVFKCQRETQRIWGAEVVVGHYGGRKARLQKNVSS